VKCLLFSAIWLSILNAPAMATERFDLVCIAKIDLKPVSARYRVDLARKQYCADECQTVEKIDDFTPGMITFYDLPHSSPSDGRHFLTFNRLSGVWRWYDYTPGVSMRIQDITGRCETTDFTGFPTRGVLPAAQTHKPWRRVR